VKVVVKDNEVDLARIIRNASPGDEILLEKGDYVVGEVFVESDLTIIGKGAGLTRLLLDGHGFTCDAVRSFRVEGLSFVGSRESEVLNVKYGRVEATNCEFTGCELASLHVEVGIAKLEGCSFHQNGYGMLLGEGSIVSVKSCKFSENEVAAVWIEGGDLRVEESTFQENGLGIATTWSSRAKIISNSFLNHTIDPAITVMERADAIITGNVFSNCRCSIMASRYSTAVIEDNTFIACGDARTPVLSISGNCSIRGNILESNRFSELRGLPIATCVGSISERQP